MTAKKSYVRPAVLSEDRVEQTSLACNATQPYEGRTAGTYATGVGDCNINVAKGLNFANANVCEIAVEGPSSVVVLS
jgi:hypothetical protein